MPTCILYLFERVSLTSCLLMLITNIWVYICFFFRGVGLNVCVSGSATSCEECLLLHPSCAWCAQEVNNQMTQSSRYNDSLVVAYRYTLTQERQKRSTNLLLGWYSLEQGFSNFLLSWSPLTVIYTSQTCSKYDPTTQILGLLFKYVHRL